MASSDPSPPLDSLPSEPAVRPPEISTEDGVAEEEATVEALPAEPSDASASKSAPESAPEVAAAVEAAASMESAPAETTAAETKPGEATPEKSPDAKEAGPSVDEPTLDARPSVDEPTLDAGPSVDEPTLVEVEPPAPGERVLPPLDLAPAAAAASTAKNSPKIVETDDDDVDAEWELTGDLFKVPESEKPEVISAAPAAAALLDRPWKDVDDLDDDETSVVADEKSDDDLDDDATDDLDDDDATSVVANEKPASAEAKPSGRAWKDVDDLEDDDDPSEFLPTRVLGVPAPTSVPVAGQRTLVPPPPSRSAMRSRAPGAPSLPAIPAPPTLPRSVSPHSVPPVAFDWIREQASNPAGRVKLALGALAVLLLGILPIAAFGAFAAGPLKRLFGGEEGGTLVVTVASMNHGPVDAPLVVADEILRCKESPCRISKLVPGTHFVRVSAPGYQEMAPRAVSIEADSEAALHIELARIPAPEKVAAPAAALDLDDSSVRPEALPNTPIQSTVHSASAAAVPLTQASRSAAAGSGAGEPGTLNLSSNPPSNVVLDGRPLGITPRSGIRVKPGPHQVVFIHPKHGRKNARANVKPGAVSNVSVRFR